MLNIIMSIEVCISVKVVDLTVYGDSTSYLSIVTVQIEKQ